MYITATRPNILYMVIILSRFMHCASDMHLKRDIKGTINYGLKFKKKLELKLHGYYDSDWTGSTYYIQKTFG